MVTDAGRAGVTNYLARCDQATFNAMALFQPIMHLSRRDTAPKDSLFRAAYDNDFTMFYEAMGFETSPGVVLSRLFLTIDPVGMLDYLRTDDLVRSVFPFSDPCMRALLASPAVEKSARMASQKSRPLLVVEN